MFNQYETRPFSNRQFQMSPDQYSGVLVPSVSPPYDLQLGNPQFKQRMFLADAPNTESYSP